MPRVLIVVTVEAQQLPVAPIGGIVVVVVVPVVDREFAQLFAAKFAPTAPTDPRIIRFYKRERYFRRVVLDSG